MKAMEIIDLYVAEMRKLIELQRKLVPVAERLVRIKPVRLDDFGINFLPTAKSVPEQIRIWEEPIFLSIASWVEPDVGKFNLLGDVWEFSFGTQEVCFSNVTDRTHVRAEYSAEGSIGVTSWAMNFFLSSKIRNGQITETSLLDHNQEFFGQLFDRNIVKFLGEGPVSGAVFYISL